MAQGQAARGGGHDGGAARSAPVCEVKPVSPAEQWFESHGWKPFGFQRDVWRAYLEGESGLVHAATGTGKTLAVWWGPLLEYLASQQPMARGKRSRQSRQLPTTLVTTPESLSLLLARDDASGLFADLRMVVVDEWHELMGTKRGIQTELALSRLRGLRPRLQTWGVSATIGNSAARTACLCG